MQKCTVPTLQQHVDIFIAHSMPVVIVAWVSIVQSRQLGTHKHFYAYSHGALNGYFCITPHFIGLCEGWYSRFSCDCSFITKVLYITASFI